MHQHGQLRTAMPPRLALVLAGAACLAAAFWTPPARAAGEVTDCTFAGLAAAMNAGSGLITFNCGGTGAPATITVTQAVGLIVAAGLNYTIDGGNVITLTGADATRLFRVDSGASLTLTNILLTNGNSGLTMGGAVNISQATLVLDHATIQNSHTSGVGGGAISANLGTVILRNNSVVQGNYGYDYGAINSTGSVTVIDSIIRDNQATTGGGGLSVGGTVVISNSQISGNRANDGGGLLITAAGNVAIHQSLIASNVATGTLGDSGGGGLRNDGTATLNHATLSGNSANGNGGGIYNSAGTTTLNNSTLSGSSAAVCGGILNGNGATTTLNNSTLSGNSTFTYGGGICNFGTATLNNSTLSGNSASTGGGISNFGTATLNSSTLSGNSADDGGGIYNNGGTVTVNNSTLSGNSAGSGGGIENDFHAFLSLLILNNSTLSNNSADFGGGIRNNHTAHMFNTTVVFNRADPDNNGVGTGGGIFNASGAAINLRNTLVAGNRQGNGTSDCAGTIGSYGRNLFYVNAGCTIVNGAGGSWSLLSDLAGIGVLQNNGGPTMTHMPRLGSQMIDGGDAADGCRGSTGALLLTDQRGKTRPVDGDGNGTAICDVGAVERQANDSDLAPWLFLPLLRR